MTTEPEAGRRIVVGVDGSAPSKAALAWAARQARLTGATVEAIIAWEYPATYGYTMPAAPEINYNYEEIAAEVIARHHRRGLRPGRASQDQLQGRGRERGPGAVGCLSRS